MKRKSTIHSFSKRCAIVRGTLILFTLWGAELHAAPFAWVTDVSSHTVNVIDVAINAMIKMIPVDGVPGAIAHKALDNVLGFGIIRPTTEGPGLIV